MVNNVVLVGNLGADPEIKQTSTGKSVGELRIATSMGSGDKEQTEWHRVVVWEKLADNCAKYLTKGRQVYVQGRIQTRSYEDKEGNKKYVTEIVAHDVKFLGGKGGDGAKPEAEANSGW
jgi:single-strand DNA-binding protein